MRDELLNETLFLGLDHARTVHALGIAGTTGTASAQQFSAAIQLAIWTVAFLQAHRIFRQTKDAEQAKAAFLAIASLISFAVPHPAHPATQPTSSQPRMPLSPLLLFIFGAAAFLYIGIENSLGGWLPSYAIRVNPTLHSSSIALYFWIAELAGRILVTILMARLSEAALYRLCLALLIAAQILLCATANISSTGVITLTILSALSLAPLYPLIVSFLLARTGNHARLGALFATVSFGGATLPWLTGIISTRFQSLRAGLLVPATSAIVLLLLSAVTTSKPRAKINA